MSKRIIEGESFMEGEGFKLKYTPDQVKVTLKMLDSDTAVILLKWAPGVAKG